MFSKIICFTVCEAGTFLHATDNVCVKCRVGSYSATGAATCTACAIGSTTLEDGSTSVEACGNFLFVRFYNVLVLREQVKVFRGCSSNKSHCLKGYHKFITRNCRQLGNLIFRQTHCYCIFVNRLGTVHVDDWLVESLIIPLLNFKPAGGNVE